MGIPRSVLVVTVAGLILGPTVSPAFATGDRTRAGRTVLASVSTAGRLANMQSTSEVISANGRYVAFISFATNLVPGDTNGFRDVFVRDLSTGTTNRVNVSDTGAQADNDTSDLRLSISADGRYVAFVSLADNLVPGDTNGDWDVFVRDRLRRHTSRVNLSSRGEQGNVGAFGGVSISADGRYVAFESPAANLVPGDVIGTEDIFVRDRFAGRTTRVSVSSSGEPANNISFDPVISADGRYVAFNSHATNLVPGDTNAAPDVFVHDRFTGTTTRESVSGTGEQANGPSAAGLASGLAISGDGRFVAFESSASNLVPADTNAADDIFVRDRRAGTTTRVSVSSAGEQANAASFFGVSISRGGRYVVFLSEASNLVPRDTNGTWDVFVRDRLAGTTGLVSVSGTGAQANGTSASGPEAVSADGRLVTFESVATNLVPGDTNGVNDVFVRERRRA